MPNQNYVKKIVDLRLELCIVLRVLLVWPFNGRKLPSGDQ